MRVNQGLEQHDKGKQNNLYTIVQIILYNGVQTISNHVQTISVQFVQSISNACSPHFMSLSLFEGGECKSIANGPVTIALSC
ncbi:MAG: hypothetical protein RL728_1198 [Bacteroidota bacterium]|jgi:hypothetical protein